MLAPALGHLVASHVRFNSVQDRGGGIFCSGELHMQGGTIAHNVAGEVGGGIEIAGGSARANLSNVALFGNRAKFGGALASLKSAGRESVVWASNVTIYRNIASKG